MKTDAGHTFNANNIPAVKPDYSGLSGQEILDHLAAMGLDLENLLRARDAERAEKAREIEEKKRLYREKRDRIANEIHAFVLEKIRELQQKDDWEGAYIARSSASKGISLTIVNEAKPKSGRGRKPKAA